MTVAASEISIGTVLPTITKTIDRARLVRYAGASGDFNPIHYDDDYAKAAGLGGVIGHGMLSFGFLSEAVTNWVGDPGLVKEIGARFVGMTHLGDVLTIGGQVTEVEQSEGFTRLVAELYCRNQGGQAIVDQCKAILVIPTSR